MTNKIMGAEEAVALIEDGSTLAVSSAGISGFADYVVKTLEERFLATGHPRGLTLLSGCGHGGPDHYADNRFAHPGFLKCAIGSHSLPAAELQHLIDSDEIEAYALPQGVMNQLYRCSAAKQPGLLSKIGVGTYIDPRQEGGRLNRITKGEIVRVLELDGDEWLFYKSHPVDVAIIRGTTADLNGNLSIEEEPLKLEILEIAMAAKASKGIVIAQVKQIVQNGVIRAKDVAVPGEIVDAIVVCEDTESYHRQSPETHYSPFMSGELRCPPPEDRSTAEDLTSEDIVCRRAVYELYPGAVVNVGLGIGAGIGKVAEIENIVEKVTFTIELGVIGGKPLQLPNFTLAVNATSYVAHPSMFDYYHGGNLDIAFLGAAEVDRQGNVNVSRFGGRSGGQGGFIDITQTCKKVVFCTYFRAKGMQVKATDGKLDIIADGKTAKFVDAVDQITFNGRIAFENGTEVFYVTERAVFKLVKEGVMLMEIAPGVDLDKDILGQMGFSPLICENLKIMDPRIFVPGRMDCFEAVIGI